MSDIAQQEQIQNYCNSQDPTYGHRVYVSESYNWCVVPDSGQDAILFAGIAVCAACLAQGRFSNSIILLTGAAIQGFMLPYNLGRFGNGIAIWLGIQPYELFFYIFLPPLLLDAAVRIDFFLFKKVVVQVITLAFLVVGGSVGVMIPIMLYVLDLHADGWTWQYVALFISMLASTDAVAIIATMKTSGGPKRLRVILEGEALLNDASSFTLFQIFLSLVEQVNSGQEAHQSGWSILWEIVKSALKLAGGGLGIGLAFGIACRYVLRFMRNMGATIDQQVSLTLALAYLSYYTANAPAAVSGVISVVVYGLYGAATSKWDMSAKVEESGAFDAFWDTLSFVVNGIVFFFSGIACINFFVRSSEELQASSHGAVLASTIWRLPLIYIFMFIARFLLTAAFRPIFKVMLGDISWRELLFATAAGLRGAVSLILAQAVVTDQLAASSGNSEIIKSEIVLWTAGFVLMTLMINVPLLPLILRKTGLSMVSKEKQGMRRRAVRALASHTTTAIDNLKQDEDEMLRGVDWGSVEQYNSVEDIYEHFQDPGLPPNAGQLPGWSWFTQVFSRRGAVKGASHKHLPKQSSLMGESGKLDTDKFFGRTKGWGSSPDDLESAVFSDKLDDELPVEGDFDKELDSSDVEEANELTSESGNEFPFLSRDLPTPAAGPAMKRSKTFSTFTRHSLLPITKTEVEAGTLAAGPPAKLDRNFKAGPVAAEPKLPPVPPPPTDELEQSRSLQRSSEQQQRQPSLGRRAGAVATVSGGSVGSKNAYVMTSAGPLLAPMPYRQQGEAGAEPELSRHDSPSSLGNLPQLRISGEALKKLVAEGGGGGKTWPKTRSEQGSGRPPLPFRASQPAGTSPRGQAPPAEEPADQSSQDGQRSCMQELNEASNRTWSGGPPNLKSASSESTPPSTTTWRRSVAHGHSNRPSVFDAFDIERPQNRHARKTVAKHQTIFDAFGITEPGSSGLPSQPSELARLSSAQSAGSSRGGTFSETTSPQQTWTAGMTKGVPPRELLQQLKRNRSAPALDDAAAEAAGSGGGPPDDPSEEPPVGDASEMGRSSSMKPSHIEHLNPSELVEARVRLVVGLKRYFHGKRLEGLLSSAALRILDNACDSCLEDPTSFKLWESLEKDATGTMVVRWLAHQTYFWRKVVIMLRRRTSENYRFLMYVRRAVAWPIRKGIGVGHQILTVYMLTGIEVAIEYMLGLTYSPQVQLLKRHDAAGEILEEVQDELDKAWKFIMDREVEAPERFQSIQTYRATTAVLKQQAVFIKSLYESGVVDDMERDELLRPIEKRERDLERTGPKYNHPGVVQILHNLPFLRHVPHRIVEILYKHGRLQMFRSGTDLAIRKTKSLYVVTSGLLKVSYSDPQDNTQEYFLASGGMLGLYTALTGQVLPGCVKAIAEGNALGKGPVVFELFQSGINLIRTQAAAGKEIFQQIELDMLRLASLYLVERLKPRLMPYLLMMLSHQQAAAARAASLGAKLRVPPTPFANQARDEADTGTPRSGAFTLATDLSSLGSTGQLRDAVLEQYTALLHDLAASEVLELPAGIPYVHRSSAVLLKGTLRTSARQYSEGRKGLADEESEVEYHAPFVFPFVPAANSSATPPRLRFVSGDGSGGSQGALLMVRPVEGQEGEPEPSLGGDGELPSRNGLDASSMSREPAGTQAAQAASEAAGSGPPVATAASKAPQLRRVSKALILNVSDTGEHAAAKRSDGKKGEWWENALSRPSKALQHMSNLPGHRHHDAPSSLPRIADGQ